MSGPYLRYMMNRNRQMKGGGVFKIYDEPESPYEGGVLNIYDEPESPSDGGVLNGYDERENHTRGRV